MGIVGEKGIGWESRTITVAVCIEVFIFFDESQSLGNWEGEYKNVKLALYNTSQKTCFDTAPYLLMLSI